jgi:hypothetical protein
MIVVLAGSPRVARPEHSPLRPLRRGIFAGYAGGAPAGFSGGFGEPSCHGCHFDAEVNARPGRVALAGVPERFAGGTSYPITITLSRPGMKLGGFQFTARFKDDGAQAGTLAPAAREEKRVRLDDSGEITYASQRQEGSSLAAPDSTRWSLVWTAPSSGGPVVFHVAANAADGDGTADGDHIHTTVIESAPAAETSRSLLVIVLESAHYEKCGGVAGRSRDSPAGPRGPRLASVGRGHERAELRRTQPGTCGRSELPRACASPQGGQTCYPAHF